MIFKYSEINRNKIAYILGIIYTVYFNINGRGDLAIINSVAYSIPFILFNLIISFVISKLIKDQNHGVYFCVISLIYLNI